MSNYYAITNSLKMADAYCMTCWSKRFPYENIQNLRINFVSKQTVPIY